MSLQNFALLRLFGRQKKVNIGVMDKIVGVFVVLWGFARVMGKKEKPLTRHTLALC